MTAFFGKRIVGAILFPAIGQPAWNLPMHLLLC